MESDSKSSVDLANFDFDLAFLLDDNLDNDDNEDKTTEAIDVIEIMGADDDVDLDQALQKVEKEETKTRFAKLEEEDLSETETSSDSKGTIKQTRWAVSLFREWLSENKESTDFKNIPTETLDNLLRRFYASLRIVQGDLYSKSTFVGIRASLNRYLRAPPNSRQFSLLDGNDFVESDHMFKSMLKKMKKRGIIARTTMNQYPTEICRSYEDLRYLTVKIQKIYKGKFGSTLP